MARLVKRWGKGRYGLWTTIADGYLHEPKKLSKEELIEFMVQDWRDDLEKKIKDLRETFPEGYWDKDTGKQLTKED